MGNKPFSGTLMNVLQIHDGHSAGRRILNRSLFDGYLYEKSPVFRSLRNQFIESGFKYELNPDYPYFSFTLSYLPRVLASRSIPYLDNVTPLRDLEKRRPGVLKIADLPDDICLAGNYHFHETAHCIANRIMKPDLKPVDTRPAARKVNIVKLLLGESFASTAEFLASISLSDTKMDQWIAGKTLYMIAKPGIINPLVKRNGLHTITKLSLLVYLYSNFLFVRLTPSHDRRIFEIAGVRREVASSVFFREAYAHLKQVALTMNPRFRVVTTGLFFKCAGYTSPLSNLLAFDPVEFTRNSPDILRDLDNLARSIEGQPPA